MDVSFGRNDRAKPQEYSEYFEDFATEARSKMTCSRDARARVILARALGATLPLLLLASAHAGAGELDKADLQACEATTATALEALQEGDFEAVRSGFDARMREGLGTEQLRSLWSMLPARVGTLQHSGPPRSAHSGALAVVQMPMKFETAWLELQLSCNPDGSVSGLFLRPGRDPAELAKPREGAPYVDPARFEESEVEIHAGGDAPRLPATLALPQGRGPFAAAVLVHGSGSHDRDGTIGPNQPLKDLAQGLASRGIATLRHEKRSKHAPGSFIGKPFTVREEAIDDALAALQWLGQNEAIDRRRLFVIGHSLGAMLAPRIAEAAPDLAGLVLLAAPARALTEIIPAQVRYLAELDGEVSTEEAAQIAEIDALMQRILALTAADAGNTEPLLGAPAAYWLDLADDDPVLSAGQLARPLLLLQGEGDYQVTIAEDYARWTRELGGETWFTARSFPGLGHLYTPASDPPSPADYERAGHVDGKVITLIADWIRAQARR